MLTPDELEALVRELNKPYSAAELSRHLTDRALKSVCEKMHAHNLALLQCVIEWRAHLQGDAPEPEIKIWKALRPGHHAENEACSTLDELIDAAIGYGYGKVPSVPILIYASRSSATLIERIDELHHTAHIDTMDAAAKEFFTLLTSPRLKKMSAEKFGAELRRLKDEFVKACTENATELHTHIFNLREIKNASKPVDAIVSTASNRVNPSISDAFETNASTSHARLAASVVEKAQAKIVKAVEEEARKTRRCVKKTATKAVREIRTNAQSEYDKRGPSSVARGFQLRAVIERMKEYRTDATKLPRTLRKKEPKVWLHQACRDVWVAKEGGYPSADSLYVYCHRNDEKILSLAGI